MRDNANVNPIWDALLGYDTNSGVIRLVGAILVFIVVGGTIGWLAL